MSVEQGTNLNAQFNANVFISEKDSANKYAIQVETNGDPNSVALTTQTFAIGCIARRSDLSSGAALYENKGNLTTPQWYVITTA